MEKEREENNKVEKEKGIMRCRERRGNKLVKER